jgi:hypothetical protein
MMMSGGPGDPGQERSFDLGGELLFDSPLLQTLDNKCELCKDMIKDDYENHPLLLQILHVWKLGTGEFLLSFRDSPCVTVIFITAKIEYLTS